MALDASMGAADEVRAHIDHALTTLKNGKFEEEFEVEDKKWL